MLSLESVVKFPLAEKGTGPSLHSKAMDIFLFLQQLCIYSSLVLEYFGINLNMCFRTKIQTNSICNGVEETVRKCCSSLKKVSAELFNKC